MTMHKIHGLFIAIDGIDGSGKGTQVKRLITRLQDEKYASAFWTSPRYGKPEAFFIENYLRGEYGTKEEISAKAASLCFAMERFHSSREIRSILLENKILVSDRWTSANKGHQMAKLHSSEEKRAFLDWINEIEYDILRTPKPDHTILMNMPADIAYDLIAKKDERAYLNGKVRDIHEMDPAFLKASQEAFLFAAECDTKETWHVLDCVENGTLLSIEDMHEKLWKLVKTFM